MDEPESSDRRRFVRFVPGPAAALIGPRVTALVADDPRSALVKRLWSSIADGVDIDELLDQLAGEGLAHLPSLGLVSVEQVGIRVLVRGEVIALLEPKEAGAAVRVGAEGVRTWVEHVQRGVSSVQLCLQDDLSDLGSFEVAAGLVPAGRVELGIDDRQLQNPNPFDPGERGSSLRPGLVVPATPTTPPLFVAPVSPSRVVPPEAVLIVPPDGSGPSLPGHPVPEDPPADSAVAEQPAWGDDPSGSAGPDDPELSDLELSDLELSDLELSDLELSDLELADDGPDRDAEHGGDDEPRRDDGRAEVAGEAAAEPGKMSASAEEPIASGAAGDPSPDVLDDLIAPGEEEHTANDTLIGPFDPESVEADERSVLDGGDGGAASDLGGPSSDTDYDHLFGATQFRTVEDAAVRSAGDPDDLELGGPPPVISSIPGSGGVGVGHPLPSHSVLGAPPLPPGVADGDHDGHTVSIADVRSARAPSGPAPAPSPTSVPMVHAIRCASGHLNPTHATDCRICGLALEDQNHVTVPRPVLGVLRFSDGRAVEVARTLLVGRAPRAEGSIAGSLPQLVVVPSPLKEVSSTHLEIRVEGWQLLVVDRQSTNGTVISLPGRDAQRLRPGEPFPITIGTLVNLADEAEFVFEAPG